MRRVRRRPPPTRMWVLPMLLIGLVSCAYYNTFFLAKKNFRAAEESVAKSETDKLPSNAEGSYQNAIAQCRKLLKRYPKSRWADDAIYLMAASYFGKGDYDSALVRLADLAKLYPKNSFGAEALFLSGMCEIKRHNYEQGQACFDRVLTEYPGFQGRDKILFARAEMASSRRDARGAIRDYEELVRAYPKSPRVEDALRHIGEIHFEAGRFDSASLAFGRLLSTARDEGKRIDAAIQQSQALIRLDRGVDALDVVRKATPRQSKSAQSSGAPAQNQAGTEETARLLLQEAAALAHLGRTTEALATLNSVVEQYKTSSYAIEAQFQIGYTYETLLDSLDAARTAYDKVNTLSARSVFKDQATQRATALKSISDLEKQAASGDAAKEARAAAALRIGEILLLDRNLVDEAIAQYKKVEAEFPDTRVAPRASYALAYIRWKMQADTLGAQQAFRDLVARYPASVQARGAIALLDSQKADTSGLYALLQAVAPDTAGATQPVEGPPDSLIAGPDTTGAVVDTLAGPYPGGRPAPFSGEGAPPPEVADSLRDVIEAGRDRVPRLPREEPGPPLPPGPEPHRKAP